MESDSEARVIASLLGELVELTSAELLQLEFDISICFESSYNSHVMTKKTGILITNLGTPSAPTRTAVKLYLQQFLSDSRVIRLPQLLWQPILRLLILTTRPQKTAKNYRKIWLKDGSPLLVYSQTLVNKLQDQLNLQTTQQQPVCQPSYQVALGMTYGSPSIEKALQQLQHCDQLIILPLYPQYSETTTAATLDAITSTFKNQVTLPSFTFVRDYYQNTLYLNAIAKSIESQWVQRGRSQQLLFSFHGLPVSQIERGDPYEKQCQYTANKIAQRLKLNNSQWQVVFQSRFGPKQWLTPSCTDTLKKLPSQGIKSIDIICPGFAVDCLETLEEIALSSRDVFLQAGGESYHYIRALNDNQTHIDLLTNIIENP